MYYSIRRFSEIIDVAPCTLRKWEKEGKLLPHHKTKGGHRVYSEDQAKKYLNPSELVISFGDDVVYSSDISTDKEKLINEATDVIRNLLEEAEKCGN